MSVSPADFELYSRVTGSPLPRSPQEQMRMAPHVYNFIRHNQYAQTKREPSRLQKVAGFLGKAALVGAGLGALYGASDTFGRGPEPSVDNETLQSDVEVPSSQNEVSTQTEYPPDKYFSPRGDYNDPENIKFGLPTNKAGRAQLSKFIDTLHVPQINEELIDDNSQLVDHPDQPPGEIPHTPQSQAIEDRLVEQAINETTFDSPYLTQTYNPDDDSIGQIKNKYTEVGLTHGGDIYTRFRDHGSTAAPRYFTRTHPQEAEAFEDLYRRGDLTGDDGINPSLLVDALLERTIAKMGGKDKQYKMGPEGWE